jgi:hypothetical protein
VTDRRADDDAAEEWIGNNPSSPTATSLEQPHPWYAPVRCHSPRHHPPCGHAARLDRIKYLTDELARVQGKSDAARELADRIRRELDAARATLKIPRS